MGVETGTGASARANAEVALGPDFVESIPAAVMIFQHEPSGSLTLLCGNRDAALQAGLDPSSWLGRSLDDLFPLAAQHGLTEQCLQVAATGEVFEQETVAGEDGWISGAFKVRVSRAESDKICLFLGNITARRAAEAEMATFRAITENATDSIGLMSADGVISYGNAAWHGMLGYDTGDADLSGVELAAIWADDGETGPGDVLAQALAGGWQGEARHVTRDGGHVEVLASIFPLADESGSTDRLAMIAQDVTERKRAEEAMLLQNEAIMEMSTPVISISEGVLLLPLVGVMDSERAAQVIDRLLGEIAATEAEVAILDVTGVPVVDTAVARNILRTVEAARVLGAEVIVTGFGPAAAQTLATLNVDFSALRTRGSLRAGVTEAYMLTGIELSRRKAK